MDKNCDIEQAPTFHMDPWRHQIREGCRNRRFFQSTK